MSGVTILGFAQDAMASMERLFRNDVWLTFGPRVVHADNAPVPTPFLPTDLAGAFLSSACT